MTNRLVTPSAPGKRAAQPQRVVRANCGRRCRLEPLTVAYFDTLYDAWAQAEDGRDWTYLLDDLGLLQAMQRYGNSKPCMTDITLKTDNYHILC